MTKVALWVWLGCSSVALVSACGDEVNETALGGAGAGGTEAGGQGHLAGAAGEAGATGDGGVGGSGAGGDGGTGGDGTLSMAERVRAQAEAGLSRSDVVLDVAELAGKSFTLESSLCGGDGAGGEGNIGGGPSGGDPLSMVHLRQAESGGLEAVTYTADGGLPLVEVTPLREVGLGFSLANVATCASLNYVFEESWETARYRSAAMHLVFRKPTASTELRAVIAASVGDQVRMSEAELDVLAPRLERPHLEGRTDVDGIFDGFTRHFVFSEPVPKESGLVIEDDSGVPVELVPRIQEGYLVGFEVTDLLSDDFQLGGELMDLVGNAMALPLPYPGVGLALVPADFEQPAQFIDQSAFDSDNYTPCETGTFPSVEDIEVPALAGDQSFLSGSAEGSCPAYLRFEAPPGATELSFDARLIGSTSAASFDDVVICVSSLGVGGDDECTTIASGWSKDPEFTAPKPAVSQVRTVTVALPTDATDLFIEVSAGDRQRLWLDSLRTQ